MSTVEEVAIRIKFGFRGDDKYDKADAAAEIDTIVQPLIGALETIAEADETSTLAGAVAIAKGALEGIRR
jgi:hypothetical protein